MGLARKGQSIVKKRKSPSKVTYNTRVKISNLNAEDGCNFFKNKIGAVVDIKKGSPRPYLVQLDYPIDPDVHKVDDIDLLEFEYFALEELMVIYKEPRGKSSRRKNLLGV